MIGKELCTGCGACAAVCPVSAITMQPDDHGFLHPGINASICIHCDRCESVCPVQQARTRSPIQDCFASWSKDAEVRRESSSGGIFSELAMSVIAAGGVVAGCAMDRDGHSAHHILVEDREQLTLLRGSKYFQSQMGDIYSGVKQALSQGRKVLFCGTPCQVAGLKSYIGSGKDDDLYLVDFICHGVPSRKVWSLYLDQKEQQMGAGAAEVHFRRKDSGWKKFSLGIGFNNGSEYCSPVTEDSYLRGFVGNLYLRSSCFHCAFKGDNYHSDLTLADFWGIDETIPGINDDQGISLILTHTDRGRQLVESLKPTTEQIRVEPVQALRSNPSYHSAVSPNPCSKHFWKDIEKLTVEDTVAKYMGSSLIAKIRRHLLKAIHI